MSNTYYKDEIICDAIKEAITLFGKTHKTNGMDYMAQMLGLQGPSKSIQLHNKLSPCNTEKFLKLEELLFIMKQMSSQEHKVILAALAEKFGFILYDSVKADASFHGSVELSVQMGAFEVTGLLGLFADEILSDLQDGKISYDEAKRLKKICTHLREKTRGIEDALKTILD